MTTDDKRAAGIGLVAAALLWATAGKPASPDCPDGKCPVPAPAPVKPDPVKPRKPDPEPIKP